jgi:hypothetical protein
VQPCDEDEDKGDQFLFFQVMEQGGMKLTDENRITRGKTCPTATLSTTNLTWTDPRSNPGLHSGRPTTNRQSHGTALMIFTYS